MINNLHIKLSGKFRISNSICRLVLLDVVWPMLEVDVQLLESEFIIGYTEGDRILYVSFDNKKCNLIKLHIDIKII